MHIHAAIWLIVFVLLFAGIFLYLRGNLDPTGKSYHSTNIECKKYRAWGISILFIAFGLAFWLYTREPKVHVYFAG